MLQALFSYLMDNNLLHYVYLTLAVICFICELFIFDFSFTCFGLGLVGAGLLSWAGLGFGWQVVAFSVISIASIIGIRPLAHKFLYHRAKNIKTNTDAIIGRTGLVTAAPRQPDMLGRVQLDGDSWRAQFKEEAKENEKVLITKIEGNTLFVSSIKKEEK